jgi:hypothetical protein
MGRGVLGVRREEKGAEVLFGLKDKSECPELVERAIYILLYIVLFWTAKWSF